MIKPLNLLLLLSLLSTDLLGQDTVQQSSNFSLDDAMEYAVKNNLKAVNARLDVASADKRVWEAAAIGLPQLNGAMTYNNNLSLATTLIPDFFNDPSDKIEVQFGTKHFATAGLSANQIIFSGEYFIGLKAAKLFKEFTQENRKLSEQNIKEAVAEGYYLVLLAENTLEALRGNLENLRFTYEQTRQLFETGFVEAIDVDQLEVTMTDLENSVLSMERQVMATRSLLKYQMGYDINSHIQLTDDLSDMVNQIDYDLLLGYDLKLEENISFRILKEQEELALMDMKMKQSEYLPDLRAFFSLDFTAQRDKFNFFSNEESWYTASAVGLSLNIPIFSSGMRMAGVAQKRIAHEKAQNDKEFAARGLQVEFRQARYDLSNAYEKFKREKKRMELSEKVIENTKSKYNEGLASSLDLTQVNDQYLQVLTNYTSAMVDLLNAKVKLDVLTNKL